MSERADSTEAGRRTEGGGGTTAAGGATTQTSGTGLSGLARAAATSGGPGGSRIVAAQKARLPPQP